VLGGAKFAKAKASLKGDYDRIVQDIITLTQIEAPPFKEDARARPTWRCSRPKGSPMSNATGWAT
jgi:hypothetical protein